LRIVVSLVGIGNDDLCSSTTSNLDREQGELPCCIHALTVRKQDDPQQDILFDCYIWRNLIAFPDLEVGVVASEDEDVVGCEQGICEI
jgi:hypothetical protein